MKNCQLPEDHSDYTIGDFSIQEATGSSDIGESKSTNSMAALIPNCPRNRKEERLMHDPLLKQIAI